MSKEKLLYYIRTAALETKDMVRKSDELKDQISAYRAYLQYSKTELSSLQARLQQQKAAQQEMQRRDVAAQYYDELVAEQKAELYRLVKLETRIKTLQHDSQSAVELTENERVLQNVKIQKEIHESVIADQNGQRQELLRIKQDLERQERYILAALCSAKHASLGSKYRIVEQLNRGERMRAWW